MIKERPESILTMSVHRMHFTLKTLAAAMAATQVSALGINCRGSGTCGIAGGKSTDLNDAIQGGIDVHRTFYNGEHIACLENLAKGGICAFLQGTDGIDGGRIKWLSQDIVNHGCSKCGSVPVFFNEGDNDVNTHGQLTFNYVSDAGGCNGLC